jgi:hypothetical protein
VNCVVSRKWKTFGHLRGAERNKIPYICGRRRPESGKERKKEQGT